MLIGFDRGVDSVILPFFRRYDNGEKWKVYHAVSYFWECYTTVLSVTSCKTMNKVGLA